MGKNNRSRKLIRYDLQLKVVFIALFVASLVLLINFQLGLAALWSISGAVTPKTSTAMVLEEIRAAIISKFLLSVIMAIPLAAAVGILYSFKFSGPVHRFKLFLADLRSGRWDVPCKLRKGDDLQDVCDELNGAMKTICALVGENTEILQRVRQLGRDGVLAASGPAEAQLREVWGEIDAALASSAARIPSLIGDPDAASAGSAAPAAASGAPSAQESAPSEAAAEGGTAKVSAPEKELEAQL